MAINAPANWIVAYDIREPRRLSRLHRHLKKVAIPLQYSVFLAHETRTGIEALVKEIEDIIETREDDVRIYRIPKRTELIFVGRKVLPDGILLLDEGQLVSLNGK